MTDHNEQSLDLQAQIDALLKENARLRKMLVPQWFYHPDEPETCWFSPDEVIDEMYDPKPGRHVFVVDCATSLPSIWCAVHVRTEEEMDALETDDRVVFTEHSSEKEAQVAISACKGDGL
jgi:hypothetical protein